MFEAQMSQEWLVDQRPITDHRGLNELKIGVLGVGQMGQCIAKTFKVILKDDIEGINHLFQSEELYAIIYLLQFKSFPY